MAEADSTTLVGYVVYSPDTGEYLDRTGVWVKPGERNMPKDPFDPTLSIVEATKVGLVHHPSIVRLINANDDAVIGERTVQVIPLRCLLP